MTETYISIRKLEDRILKKIGGSIRVSIENFYGIEINDFAVQISKLALWISEHQMNGTENFLPLKRNANIVEADSLEIDWKSATKSKRIDFIMGNPPYVGYLWKDLFEDGIRINFAHRSFKWNNESPDRKHVAQVHCIVVGFSRFDRAQKWIFENGERIAASQINAYLIDAQMTCVEIHRESLTDVPKARMGSMPRDGRNLIIEAEDLDAFIERAPRSKNFIRKLVGGEEFIKNIPRYCLWLIDAEPNEIKSIKPIYERVQACKKFRESSKKKQTRDAANTPWLFQEIRQPINGKFIAIPVTSAGTRKYIPIGFFNSETIAKNQICMIPNGSLELFGILTSSVHMAWTRVVGAYFSTSYSYSINVVYNNFPFPKSNPKIEVTAQKILDARKNHPNSSLAELYDPNLMPQDLRKAHDENDRAVLDAYGFPRSITESEIVAKLFEMYQDLTK